MTSSVARFLEALPVEAKPDQALLWIAGIAAEVGGVLGVPAPTAFQDLTTERPERLADALALLQKDDFTPDVLGLAWEQLLATADRRAQGAHFTPRHVADRVIRLGLDDLVAVGGNPVTVWDPTAGGGAFLLSAARAIAERTDRERGEIVASLFATDIDETALRVCDAALEMWAGGAARPTTVVTNSLLALPESWPDDFSLIVGNPPFLGQLTSDTARSQVEQSQLKERYGELAAAYVDHSSLFVELGLRHLGDHSVLALILPQSFLGARDSEGVRRSVLQRGSLRTLWIDDARSFSASVEVLALIVAADGTAAGNGSHGHTQVVVGKGSSAPYATPPPVSWAALLARSQGVPLVAIAANSTLLGEVATVTAGFRQHFYGIGNAVAEAGESSAVLGATSALLMTSGSIDPFAPGWGQKPVKFAGNRWERPWLYLDRIEDADVQRWFKDRLVPKILVASQTPVIEAVVDGDALMVPSVPVITIEPHDPLMLWHIAAAVSAPTTCAHMISNAAGTGLSARAIRVRARALSEIPLPKPSREWDEAALLGQQAQTAWLAGDVQTHSVAMRGLGEAMTSAYGGSSELTEWWVERLPRRRK